MDKPFAIVQAHGFTLQIGDPNIITEITQIPGDFRFFDVDMAAGGQGARWFLLFTKICSNMKAFIASS